MDVMALLNSDVNARGDRLHRQMGEFQKRLGLAADWRYLLAASYSQLGFFATSPELDEAIRKGTILTPRDREELKRSFDVSADILQHIPGLEPVVGIIRHFAELLRLGDYPAWNGLTEDRRGAVMLALLFESYILRMRNYSGAKIIEQLNRQLRNLPGEPLRALQALLEAEEESISIRSAVSCDIPSLKPGMVLMEDIFTRDRRKLVSAGTEMTENLIILLRHFLSRGMIRADVQIVSYSYAQGGPA